MRRRGRDRRRRAAGVGWILDTAGTLTTGLVAYWKLEEASGTRVDQKGTNHLSPVNAPGNVAGKRGNALMCETTGLKHLSRAITADLTMGNIDFSIAYWVKRRVATLDHYGHCGSWEDSVQKAYALAMAGTGHPDKAGFAVSPNGVDSFSVISSQNLSVGTYNLIIAIHDSVGDTIKIYVDGVLGGTLAYASGVFAGPFDFQVGDIGAGHTVPNHDIDELGVWKKVLSAQEISDLFNGGAGNSFTG